MPACPPNNDVPPDSGSPSTPVSPTLPAWGIKITRCKVTSTETSSIKDTHFRIQCSCNPFLTSALMAPFHWLTRDYIIFPQSLLFILDHSKEARERTLFAWNESIPHFRMETLSKAEPSMENWVRNAHHRSHEFEFAKTLLLLLRRDSFNVLPLFFYGFPSILLSSFPLLSS